MDAETFSCPWGLVRLPAPGDRFAGRFRIERELGHGGFATVFAAHDETTGERVALKIQRGLPGHDKVMRARFRREVAIVAKLRDPHTVKLRSHGDDEGHPWAAFELVPGGDLHDLLNDRWTLNPTEVRHILRQVLQSLAEAHRLGLVHRDLKPENIRVFDGPEGALTVKVLDFGIARPTDEGAPSLTATGEVIGTYRYMSPEQLYARPLTAASDIYSAGLIAFEMLAGRDQLSGGSIADQLERIRPEHRFELLEANAPTSAIHDLVRRMLSVDPATRIGTCEQALQELERWKPPHEKLRPHLSHKQTAALDLPDQEGIATDAPTAPLGARTRVLGNSGFKLWMVAGVGALVCAALVLGALSQDDLDQPPAERRRENPLSAAREVASEPEPTPAKAPEPEPTLSSGWMDLESGAEDRTYVFVPDNFDAGKRVGIVTYFMAGQGDLSAAVDAIGIREIATANNLIVLVPPTKSSSGENVMCPNSHWHRGAVVAASVGLQNFIERFGLQDPDVFLIGQSKGGTAVDRYVTDELEPRPTAIVTSVTRYLTEPIVFAAGLIRDSVCAASLEERGRMIEGVPFYPGVVPQLDFTPLKDGNVPYDGGHNGNGGGPFLSAAQRYARLGEAHGCDMAARRPVDADGCWTYDCRTPLQICEVTGRYWTPDVPWRIDTVGSFGEFDFAGEAWRFFERARGE